VEFGEDYPLIEVGKWTLNRNPGNYFVDIEQAAFEPSNAVPGIGWRGQHRRGLPDHRTQPGTRNPSPHGPAKPQVKSLLGDNDGALGATQAGETTLH
jgi:hypothetical protein